MCFNIRIVCKIVLFLMFFQGKLLMAANNCEPFFLQARGFEVHLEPGQVKTYCFDTSTLYPMNLSAFSITAKQPYTNWYGNVIKSKNFDLSMMNITTGLIAYHHSNYFSEFIVNGSAYGIPLSNSIILITVKLNTSSAKALDLALTYTAAAN